MLRPSAGAVGVATFTVLPLFLVGALGIQLSADIGVPVSALGIASAAFFGSGALASYFAGRVATAYGVRTTMRASLVLVIMVLLFLAVGVHSLAGLVVILALGGMGNALAQPSVNLYLAERIDRHRQGTAYGIKQSAIPVAGMLAGLAVPIIGLTVGWRWAFALFALPAVLLAIYTPNARLAVRSTQAAAPALRLPRKALMVISTGSGLGMAAGSSLSIFLVPGAVVAGWSPGQAGVVFAGASIVGVSGRLLSGVLADRRDEKHLQAIALMLVAGAIGFLALALSHQWLYVVGASIAFGFGWGWTGLLIHAVVQLSPADPAASTGLVQVGTSSGAVIGPLIFGFIVEHFSYRVAWGAAGLELLLGSAILLVAAALTRSTLSPTLASTR
ncbi:MFS transporter [Salinisphaera aquimarina]